MEECINFEPLFTGKMRKSNIPKHLYMINQNKKHFYLGNRKILLHFEKSKDDFIFGKKSYSGFPKESYITSSYSRHHF